MTTTLRRLLMILGLLLAVVIPNKAIIYVKPPSFSGPVAVSVKSAYLPIALDQFDDNVVPFRQPIIYALWWKEIEICTGLTIPSELEHSVRFVYVDAGEAFWLYNDPNAELLLGYTDFPRNKIYLIKWGVANEMLVKHEMTHVLMQYNGDNRNHPPEYYDKCHLRPVQSTP